MTTISNEVFGSLMMWKYRNLKSGQATSYLELYPLLMVPDIRYIALQFAIQLPFNLN